jgi:hypothetical protein
MEVNCVITKSDGNLPLKGTKVSTVNNLLHSMFESVRLTINDLPITSSPSCYGFKAYISDVLTYSTQVKSAQLASQGFYPDLSEHMDPVDDKSGFTDRMCLFRKKYDETADYKSDGTTLFGRLMHDLVSCQTGLPPNTKVKFELDGADDSFVILSKKEDNEKYKLKILNIALHVPVAQLSSSVFAQISSIMTNKSEPRPIGIHYRRVEVRPFSLPRNKLEYNSDGLFSDSDSPCRIVVCFVLTESKVGKYHLNPFDFRRSWSVPVTQVSNTVERTMSEREMYLEQRLRQIEERFQEFQQTFSKQQKSKGKGKGKKSKNLQTEIEEEAQRRLQAFLASQQANSNSNEFYPTNSEGINLPSTSGTQPFQSFQSCSRVSDDRFTNDSSSVYRDPVPVTTKDIFITKIEITINGTPVYFHKNLYY